jgi:hypothetical protein
MSTSVEAESAERPRAGTSYVSVGIPQGLFVDPSSGEIMGAVQRGGELVSLEPDDYELWDTLLIPRDSHDHAQALARLRDRGLIAEITREPAANTKLTRLRPIPLGAGLGNANRNADRFGIQNATYTLPGPVELDAITVMFWWDMDGSNDVAALVERAAARLPEFPQMALERAAVEIVERLMAKRLLYLDAPRTPSGGVER